MLSRRLAGIPIALLASFTAQDEPSRTTRPNLVFIIADDCTIWDLGCYGGQAHTPNLDRLAREGMRFTNCFQAAPMCSPTRHNLYTGLWPVTSGAYPNHTRVEPGTKSIAHYLKPLGYRVALSGKKHIAPRKAFPFEYSGRSNPDYAAIDKLMAECKEGAKPFCLFACSNEPHSPWNKGDPSRYPAAELKLPPYFVDTKLTRSNYRNYLAEITYFDGQVGRILDLIDKHEQRDNTLVIVVSEQGSSFPFAKWTCYGMGLQSGCIARWPDKIAAGSKTDAIVEYIDVVPTFLEAAGGEIPSVLQGKSFLGVLRGKTERHKTHTFGLMTTRGINRGSDHFGIRTVFDGRFRYIWNLTPDVEFQNACTTGKVFREWIELARGGDLRAAGLVARYRRRPAVELYDVTNDRFESNNLAGDPRFATRETELRRRLVEWMKLCGDEGQATEMRALEHQNRRRQKRNAKRKVEPKLTPLERDRRGDRRLKAGEFAKAIADFDAFLAAEPELEPHHWRRGIAYYYSGEFAKGMRQFEVHREVNRADVENAAWHFLCKARRDGVAAARKGLLPVHRDVRIPMMTIYEMFAGRAKPADVLRRAEATRRAGSALFYGHLYVGLYYEATGDLARARNHITLAATKHTSSHYMGDIARMHAKRLAK